MFFQKRVFKCQKVGCTGIYYLKKNTYHPLRAPESTCTIMQCCRSVMIYSDPDSVHEFLEFRIRIQIRILPILYKYTEIIYKNLPYNQSKRRIYQISAFSI